jgi:hypothetical protein
MGWSQGFDVNIGVDAALGVHDQVPQQVGLDDGRVDVAVEVDNVLAVEALGAVVLLDPCEVVIVRQHLVPVVRVLGRPGLGCQRVALVEGEWIDFPRLPDLLGESGAFAACSPQWLLRGRLPLEEVCGLCGDAEHVRVQDDEDEADEGYVQGDTPAHLRRDAVPQACCRDPYRR